jgi:hypothetical protein
MQRKGYVKVLAEGKPYLVRAEERELHCILQITIQSGPQYRLGNVRFVNMDDGPLAFDEALLRQQLELKRGDLFDAAKVRQALDDLARLYHSKGYVDMVCEPETHLNDKTRQIDLVLEIQAGIPYRISQIDFPLMRANPNNQFQLPQSVGDLFQPSLWREFFETNQFRLPPGASEEKNMIVRRNTPEATVHITVDFAKSKCPEPEVSPLPEPMLRTKTGP